MLLLRSCMKIHTFLLILLTMVSRAQWEHGLTLQTPRSPILARPLYALWGALLSWAPGKVGTQLLKKNQPQSSTQYLGMSREKAAEQHIYHSPTWEKAKPISSPRRAQPRTPDSCWANMGPQQGATSDFLTQFKQGHQATSNRKVLGIADKTETYEPDGFLSCIFLQPPIFYSDAQHQRI